MLLRAAVVYAVLAAFAGVFSAVYLHFSFGVSSPFMVYLFVPPLLLGALPALLIYLFGGRTPSLAARRLWNSAVAALSTGFLVRAVINISGRYTSYDTLYWALAGALVLGAIAAQAAKRRAVRRRAQTAV